MHAVPNSPGRLDRIARCASRLSQIATAVAAGVLLNACGGSAESGIVTVAADGTQVRPASGGVVAPPGPMILTHPQDAAVGAGAGVAFTVAARATRPDVITGYRWIKDGTTVVAQGLAATSYSIPSVVAAAHAGVYTVEVLSTNGSITSAPARLTVVSNGWAALGGRPITTGTLGQQAALSLCDGPTVAWLAPGNAGVAQVRVSRFDGKAWIQVGFSLNFDPGRDASDPAIDCSTRTGTPRPVVAWSEATGNGRAIQVKTWTGAQWVAVGGVGSAAGTDSHKPVLRLAPVNANWVQGAHVFTRSAIGWLESGRPRAKFWSGQSWASYAVGQPSGGSSSSVALTLDLHTKIAGREEYPPLLASINTIPVNRTSVSVEANWAGWAPLGAMVSPVSPAATPLSIIGIGYGTEAIGPAAVAVWTAGTQNYSIGSSQLRGGDYFTGLLQPLQAQQSWSTHATPYTGSNLRAVSFDPRARTSECSLGGRLIFALAVNDERGTSVLRGRCFGSVADPLEWETLYTVHKRPAVSLSLRLASDLDPLFASVEPVAAGHAMSVWRFYR